MHMPARHIVRRFVLLFIAALTVTTASLRAADSPIDKAQGKPNIVFILADDMGYGDVRAYNSESKIPTPAIDRLAAEGMRFTDGHSPSAVCTPTRYATLTGRYCWRTRLKRGVLGGYSKPLIQPERSTIATLLAQRGYHTAAIGKWHLGMDMPARKDGKVNDQWAGDGGVDYTGKITDSPIHHGFDYYFGNSASLDMAPYVWIENDRFVTPPTVQQKHQNFPAFVRKGPRAEDFVLHEVLDTLGEKAADYITQRSKFDKPFFLYLPLTAPHKPVIAHPRFEGKSGLGPYGDFIMNVDAVVGQVLAAIDQAGVTKNTLVVYTSDNGNFMYERKPGSNDHVTNHGDQGYAPENHRPNYHWRGTKADVYEAGHRVPLLVRWPGRIKPGSTSDHTTTLTDFYATFAEIVGHTLDTDEAEDSFSLLPVLTGSGQVDRAPVINHSVRGMFAIREGKWKLIAGNGSGGRERPRGKPFDRPYQLYNLEADPGETDNLIEKHPDVAKRLEARLDAIRNNGRSR